MNQNALFNLFMLILVIYSQFSRRKIVNKDSSYLTLSLLMSALIIFIFLILLINTFGLAETYPLICNAVQGVGITLLLVCAALRIREMRNQTSH